MLNDIDPDEEDSISEAYWPDEDNPKQTYGHVEVELVKVNAENSLRKVMTTRDFRVRVVSDMRLGADVGGIQTVRQFQLLTWPSSDELPANRSDLLDLMDGVQVWQQQQEVKQGQKGRVIIHCLDGASQSGIYCALSHTLDRMKLEQEVDAFLAVRNVVHTRPQFITTLAQYSFLFEMAVECMNRYTAYANFH